MTPEEYQSQAMRTCARAEGERAFSPDQLQTLNAALGLSGEAGELVDYIKKGFFHGHALSPEKIADEAGDVLWYLAVLLDAFGLKLEDVMRQNVAKLRRRYPEGFSQEASIHRSE